MGRHSLKKLFEAQFGHPLLDPRIMDYVERVRAGASKIDAWCESHRIPPHKRFKASTYVNASRAWNSETARRYRSILAVQDAERAKAMDRGEYTAVAIRTELLPRDAWKRKEALDEVKAAAERMLELDSIALHLPKRALPRDPDARKRVIARVCDTVNFILAEIREGKP